ncbi:hypothetical protein [Streptomyces sp. NPDC057939]|uniref:hypothetical protein n=1 Tax=Streptomyces sp. NPDC057939 TaxID=3346284 RepID=UPI0036ED252A
MAITMEFFVAGSDAMAAGMRPRDRDHGLPAVFLEGFYPEEAVLEWESLFIGEPVRRITGPRMVVPIKNDGFGVFEVGEVLRTSLAGSDARRLGEIADLWAALDSRLDDEVSAEEAAGILREVGAVAKEATKTGQGLYCWLFAP